jgi:signal peptidase I
MPEKTPAVLSSERGERQNKKNGFCAEAYEWVETFSFGLVIFVLIFSFVFREAGVYGDSMLDTLQDGNRLIICNLDYKPKCGDIVVVYAKDLHKTIVKRVIAVGGQTVNIDYAAHRVYVDGILQIEPFVKSPTAFMGEQPIVDLPAKVPQNCVFVMGDNRNKSIDSRSGEIGMINTKFIIGKALLRYFPFNEIKLLGSA